MSGRCRDVCIWATAERVILRPQARPTHHDVGDREREHEPLQGAVLPSLLEWFHPQRRHHRQHIRDPEPEQHHGDQFTERPDQRPGAAGPPGQQQAEHHAYGADQQEHCDVLAEQHVPQPLATGELRAHPAGVPAQRVGADDTADHPGQCVERKVGQQLRLGVPLEQPNEAEVGKAQPKSDGQFQQNGPRRPEHDVGQLGLRPAAECPAVLRSGVAGRQGPIATDGGGHRVRITGSQGRAACLEHGPMGLDQREPGHGHCRVGVGLGPGCGEHWIAGRPLEQTVTSRVDHRR